MFLRLTSNRSIKVLMADGFQLLGADGLDLDAPRDGDVMVTCTACGEVMRTHEAEKHQKEVCPFKITACPSGCGWQGYWGLLADHLESDCEMMFKPCPFQCGHLIRPCRPDIHNKFCPAQTKTVRSSKYVIPCLCLVFLVIFVIE